MPEQNDADKDQIIEGLKKHLEDCINTNGILSDKIESLKKTGD